MNFDKWSCELFLIFRERKMPHKLDEKKAAKLAKSMTMWRLCMYLEGGKESVEIRFFGFCPCVCFVYFVKWNIYWCCNRYKDGTRSWRALRKLLTLSERNWKLGWKRSGNECSKKVFFESLFIWWKFFTQWVWKSWCLKFLIFFARRGIKLLEWKSLSYFIYKKKNLTRILLKQIVRN